MNVSTYFELTNAQEKLESGRLVSKKMKVKTITLSPTYSNYNESISRNSGGQFVICPSVKSKAELEAENRELIKRIDRLEQYIATIKEKGVYISERSWQSDIQQIATELWKARQAGLLCFIPQKNQ